MPLWLRSYIFCGFTMVKVWDQVTRKPVTKGKVWAPAEEQLLWKDRGLRGQSASLLGTTAQPSMGPSRVGPTLTCL